ncbi:MAG: hypothetical protein QJR09_00555 [Micrococcus sp.]|nr:hypothetical protein [Micrococcus sp.]
MSASRARSAPQCVAAALATGLLLTGCGGGDQTGGGHQTAGHDAATYNREEASSAAASPTTTTPGSGTAGSATPTASVSGQRFDSLNALFAAVDEQFGCPDEASGDYTFMVEAQPTGLPGRQCGTTVLMTWSDDAAAVQEALEMLASAGGEVPVAQGPGWFVADTSNAGDTGGGEAVEPESKDLEKLAEELGATYAVH